MKNTDTRQRLGCVVMAAGKARRFGKNKLAASLDGRSLIRRALDTVPVENLDAVVVVTQYPEIMRLAKEYHFAALYNAHPEYGISYTIQLGLTALRDCDAVMFQVADQPLLQRESVAALTALWRKNPQHMAALGHGETRGNPCIFPAKYFPALLRLTEDQGGSVIIQQHEEELRLWEVPADELADVDTPEALESLREG